MVAQPVYSRCLELAVEHLGFFGPSLGGQEGIQRSPFQASIACTGYSFQSDRCRYSAATAAARIEQIRRDIDVKCFATDWTGVR